MKTREVRSAARALVAAGRIVLAVFCLASVTGCSADPGAPDGSVPDSTVSRPDARALDVGSDAGRDAGDLVDVGASDANTDSAPVDAASDDTSVDAVGSDATAIPDAPGVDAYLRHIVSLSVVPTSATIAAGATFTFRAEYVYDDATRSPATVAWAAAPPSVARIDAAGVATGVGRGTATVTADDGMGRSGTARLDVSAAVLTGGFLIMPRAVTIDQSASVVYTAFGDYSDGVRRQVTNAEWTSSDATVATIDRFLGIASGIAPGVATITGQVPTTPFTDSTTLTVRATPPPPGAVGAACAAAADCDPVRNVTCYVDPVIWPGGYCTLDCTADRICPAGSSCYPVGSLGSTYYCIRNCTPDPNPALTIRSSCRPGYCCFHDAATPVGGCFAARGATCP